MVKCCLCNKEIEKEPITGWDQGNNALPLKDGRCCNDCNMNKVVPERIHNMQKYQRKKKEKVITIRITKDDFDFMKKNKISPTFALEQMIKVIRKQTSEEK